jgi:rRNA maturation endonuclease Nob1
MGKDGLGKALLILGGLALLAKILEEAGKNNNKVYRCWRCNYVLTKGQACCPNCGQPQDWRGVQ